MKKSLATLWILAALVVGMYTGCTKNTTGPDDTAPAGVTDEQTSMNVAAENDEFVKNDELSFADQQISATDYVYLAGRVDASITPIRWGRFVNSVTRTVTTTIQAGDTIAIARVHKNITGTLKIRAIRGIDTVLIEKQFNDQSDRNVVFRRVQRVPQYWRNWVPVATSLVDGGTTNSEIDIKALTVISGNDSVRVTDPLNFYLRYRWLRSVYGDRDLFNRNRDMMEFNGGGSITVRVTLQSSSADTDFVALRSGFNAQYKNRSRMLLVSQTPNTGGYLKVYEKTVVLQNRPGQFHAAVEAMTKATLFDDTAAYNVSWWGVPYRVF